MLSILLSAAMFAEVAGTDCAQRLSQHLQTDLQLDYVQFDQTEDSGFRVLAAGCPSEAADLIEAYIEANQGQERSLHWHVAQLRGEAGQTALALRAARGELNPDESADAEFRWNDHVNAYIAFLQGERDSFERHRAALHAAAAAHPGNAMNARLWDGLAPYFDQGYASAVKLWASRA